MTVFNPYTVHPHHPNHFGFGGLDRDDDRRKDPELILRILKEKQTKILPVWGMMTLFKTALDDSTVPEMACLSPTDFLSISPENTDKMIYLGRDRAHAAVIAVSYDGSEPDELKQGFSAFGVFGDLREAGPLISEDDGSILAYARGVCLWHQRHNFCSVCGQPTRPAYAGHQRICMSQACGASHFPRTDAAVIMLVTDTDRILLGRQPQWPEGMVSALAGFVEPGETLEHAVAREIFEEAGVIVSDVSYQHSQPWPFPASLMLGFRAKADTTKLTINQDEIEHAGWYSADDIQNFSHNGMFLPRKLSIARRLIDDWLAEQNAL